MDSVMQVLLPNEKQKHKQKHNIMINKTPASSLKTAALDAPELTEREATAPTRKGVVLCQTKRLIILT